MKITTDRANVFCQDSFLESLSKYPYIKKVTEMDLSDLTMEELYAILDKFEKQFYFGILSESHFKASDVKKFMRDLSGFADFKPAERWPKTFLHIELK